MRVSESFDRWSWAALILIAYLLPAVLQAEQINPYPREVLGEELALRWDFTKGTQGWTAGHHCEIAVSRQVLEVTCTGNDPYLYSPPVLIEGPAIIKVDMKNTTEGKAQIFWLTGQEPDWSEGRSARFEVEPDGKWHQYSVELGVKGNLKQLRFDPPAGPGKAEVRHIEVLRKKLHPLELEAVSTGEGKVEVEVVNHSDKPLEFSVNGKAGLIAGGQKLSEVLTSTGSGTFEAYAIVVASPGLPALRRTVFLYRPGTGGNWLSRTSGEVTLRAAPDGSGAELEKAGKVAAILAPLVHQGGIIPKLTPAGPSTENGPIRFRGDGVEIELALNDGELDIRIDSNRDCEGPVLRAQGNLEQGLFCGLEYLGKGEKSSSKLDIETEEHLRYAPDVMSVTVPLMACVTEYGASALLWRDMDLQPVFAAPNFFDGCNDQRMSLKGKRISATILVGNTGLEDVILWAMKKIGLPGLPPAPRNWEEQKTLCVSALTGCLKSEQGWGHCAEQGWPRRPFADHASTLWRLTGRIPELGEIVLGGAHIRNDAIYFVTGRANEWLISRRRAIQDILSTQQADGSYRYQGQYRRGHFEDTASGYCASFATELLDFAWVTGDESALRGGVKALEYMKRFSTPRGAQTWEVPLHTPDLLASAYLVWSYVRGYQLTGNQEYLQLAHRWALSGIPFVYLWGNRPIMTYATIAVYGATNWVAPNWMGLPVQWCGVVYAYALTLLAEYDKSFGWRQLAEGIVITAEQMQYQEDLSAGCLPDSFELKSQRRCPPGINPCALVSLRLALAGQVDSLSVAADGNHRVAAPFKVVLAGGKIQIDAKQGLAYQVLMDGKKVIDVVSQGRDLIELE